MATKFLHSLTDDNPDLQKQIGCMTGIFQLFDRQHIITPRRITGHSTKRIHSGVTFEKESSTIYNRSATVEKHSSKHVLERQILSTESSRASFSSSSRSSSFSSLDYNKTGQTEPFDRIIFPETPSRDPAMSQANTSPQFGRQMLDLREVVKDSMYREAQGLPVKTVGRDGAADSLAKHRDSPGPVQLSRANDGSYGQGVNGKQDLPVDLKESLRVLSKLREAPWYTNELRELSRSSSYQSKDGSSFSLVKEAPRFSYDGREMRNVPFESQDNSKSSLKFKELPRLSLDSRENSMRNFNSDLPPDLYLKFPLKENGSSNSNVTSQQQKSGTQSRPPSVVAKLMGLEALPDSISSAGSSELSDLCRPIQVSNSAKNLWKEPRSPRWKNPDSIMKPISRFPIEPAPWKQMDGNWSSQKPACKGMKAPAKSPFSFPSVYSEIEKRIKDLEYSQSGKDLRALKQILEAMQTKGLLEIQKEEALNFSASKDHEQRFMNSTSARTGSQRKLQNDIVSTSTRRGTMSSRKFESPIVIMKPAKLVEKSGIPASSVLPIDDLSSLPQIQGGTFSDSRRSAINSRAAKDQIPKSGSRDNAGNSKDMKSNNRVLKSPQTSVKSPQLPKESSAGSLKSSGSISPRMQPKRQELEKRSRPPIPPSDLSRTRRQPNNKQATESSSPGGRRRQKSMNLQLSGDQLSENTNESRNLSYHENEISAQSDGSILSDSRLDVEVTSAERSPEISSGYSPSMEAVHYLVSDLINKKSMPIAIEEEPLAEHPTVAPEYPSPVSVLDSAMDMDDSPSPVKRITKTFRGDESHETNVIPNTEECSVVDSLATNAVGPCPASEISRKKLQNVENLVQKLRRLNSSHDEARIDYIASLCDNTNPDHRYISEILLASGLLLRDLGSSLTNFQFDPSGPPINPKLFLVLEQTKGGSTYLKEECAPEKAVQLRSKQKVHRKLIFDTINEILARKLAILELSSDPWLRPLKLARESLNAQKLLRELCSEVELLQGKSSKSSLEDEDDGLKTILWEDVMNRSENWTAFNSEVSSMVLDVERMIFKDLVDEVVIGEAPALRNKPVGRRQLFAK
nr:protein LONGIFOLIA 1-like isoform X2 [Coffea arabica]